MSKLESSHEHPHTEPISVESGCLKHDIAALKAASVDVSNRLRRNNLLFLGIDDTDKETWKDSEDKVLAFCKDKLAFEIFPNSIERAHRIGTHSPHKKRPIIVKFVNFKTKEEILSCGPKLKNTNFAVREDFAATARLARSKLLKFIRPAKCAFKLRLDRLHVGQKCYYYDAPSDSVLECTKSLANVTENAESSNIVMENNN